jgi:hypothetical protein
MRNIYPFLQTNLVEGFKNENLFIAQLNKVYLEYYQEPQSMKVVAKKGICPISKHRAGFYTTNPQLFPSIVQPSNTVKP